MSFQTKHHIILFFTEPEEAVMDLSLSQPFNLESACGTPKYTNYTVGFADCLDYIYFQNDRLAVDMVSNNFESLWYGLVGKFTILYSIAVMTYKLTIMF